MGWFWSDTAAGSQEAPHPIPTPGQSPPPGCPMHKSESVSSETKHPTSTLPPSSCPHKPSNSHPTATAEPQHTSSSSTLSKLNPLNWMPYALSQERAPGQNQDLPLSREPSTIPKGDGTGNWEYPSPQQMYNAMLRKGYTDTPVDAVESMVAVHNFLNEGAWAEIVEWERRFSHGLAAGWRNCARGEDGSEASAELGAEWHDKDIPEPRLTRFTGRPDEMTPKAQLMQALGKAFPAKFGSSPPFDRHDWFVRRCNQKGMCKEVRYVIDYYEGEPEPTGEPVFFLDVRPAVDGPTAACERLLRWGGDVWWRASGGIVRELEQQKERRRSRS